LASLAAIRPNVSEHCVSADKSQLHVKQVAQVTDGFTVALHHVGEDDSTMLRQYGVAYAAADDCKLQIGQFSNAAGRLNAEVFGGVIKK
jgi:hypothetical protein